MEEGTEEKEKVVLMWGYLPGATPEGRPLLYPMLARLPKTSAGDARKDVCAGGRGFAMAISESGKLITWGSSEDEGLSHLASGENGETPEAFPLPTGAAIVQAAAGWANCAAVTVDGGVYTWGYKECIPTEALGRSAVGFFERDALESQDALLSAQVSPSSQVPGSDEGISKCKRSSSPKQSPVSSPSSDETFSVPCPVILGARVRIMTVAAGGCHTLALSDAGQVWSWGCGRDGQLGLASRICMALSPHPVPCVESTASSKDVCLAVYERSITLEGQAYKVAGSTGKAVACGGRHSAEIMEHCLLLVMNSMGRRMYEQ